jgi:hypothetical protein
MVEAGEAIEIPGAVWLSPIGPLTEHKTRRQAAMWALCDMLDEVLTEVEECNPHDTSGTNMAGNGNAGSSSGDCLCIF